MPKRGRSRRAGEIDVDAVGAHRQGGDEVKRLVVAVEPHGVAIDAGRHLAHRLAHRGVRTLQDVVAKRDRASRSSNSPIISQQAPAADIVAGGKRIEVADDLDRLAHIAAHDLDQRFVHARRVAKRISGM